MTYWLTSHNRKVHQRAINKLVRAMNKNLQQDNLWCGRFKVTQKGASQWHFYSDGSGADLYVCLKFSDLVTGRAFFKSASVNDWRGLRANGYKIWETMNWLITEHWDIWKEDFAQERNFDAWRHYNATQRAEVTDKKQ